MFILALDTEIEPSSLATHVHCEIDGIAEQIGIEFLSGEAREYELLRVSPGRINPSGHHFRPLAITFAL